MTNRQPVWERVNATFAAIEAERKAKLAQKKQPIRGYSYPPDVAQLNAETWAADHPKKPRLDGELPRQRWREMVKNCPRCHSGGQLREYYNPKTHTKSLYVIHSHWENLASGEKLHVYDSTCVVG